MEQEIAVIAGAGPAGLTAAYELLTRTNIKPLVFEKQKILEVSAKRLFTKEIELILVDIGFFPNPIE